MTSQEIFDKVARHLLTQGKQSLSDEIGCAYRGEDGLKCAIGCLITDEEYDALMEGKTVTDIIQIGGLKEYSQNSFLLKELQDAHDLAGSERIFVDNVKVLLSNAARRHSLDSSVVNEFA